MSKCIIYIPDKYAEWLDEIRESEELKEYKLTRGGTINQILSLHLEGFEIREKTIQDIKNYIEIPF